MIYVGIDWARDRHYVVVLDGSGTRLHEQFVAHTAEALAALADGLAGLEPDPAAVRVAIELHDGGLLAWLVERSYSIYPLNPKSADRARDRYRPAGGKDDRMDAFVLADTLRTDGGYLRQFRPTSRRAQELLSWLGVRDGLVRERTAKMQQLRALLDEWCPELSALCHDLKCIWQRELLEAFPLQHDLAGVDAARVAAACGRKLSASAKKRLDAALAAQCLPLPAGRREALAWQLRELVTRIGELTDRIQEIEEQLTQLVDAHPQARLVRSLPVKGIVTCATLLAVMEQAEHASWRELAARWGVAPVTKQSGKSRNVRRRRGCDHFVCQVLMQFAHCTAQVQGSWAREMYRSKRAAGVEHFTALRQVANRWVKVVCAMWRDNAIYDEQFHQANRLQAAA